MCRMRHKVNILAELNRFEFRDFLLVRFFSFLPLRVIHISVSRWTFHLSLRDSKTPQIFSAILRILVDLNNAVVWMVSILTLIFNPSSIFSDHFGTIPTVLTLIDITMTFILHSFLNLRLSASISLPIPSFSFTI